MEEHQVSGGGAFAPGTRLRGAASGTEVIVVRPARHPVALGCAGGALVRLGEDAAAAAGPGAVPGAGDGPAIVLGKRYADEQSGVELLCTKAGAGPLTADGRELKIKSAEPLPSSD